MTSDLECLKSGSLQKKGDSFGLWKRVGVVLERCSDDVGANLIYNGGLLGFDTKSIKLRRHTVRFEKPPDKGNGDFSVTVKYWEKPKLCCSMGIAAKAWQRTRTFHFRAESVRERDSWIQEIEKIISSESNSESARFFKSQQSSLIDFEIFNDHTDADTGSSSDGHNSSTGSEDGAVPSEALGVSTEPSKESTILVKKRRRSASLKKDENQDVQSPNAVDLCVAKLEGNVGECLASLVENSESLIENQDVQHQNAVTLCVASLEGDVGECMRWVEQNRTDEKGKSAIVESLNHSLTLILHYY
jgi:hypothetical protein